MAGAGDWDRARKLAADAERTARSVTPTYDQAVALTCVAAAAARAGDYDLAERIASSLTSPDLQARALADLASGVTEPTKARSWIAGALAAGRWTIPLQALALVDPAALSAFADELTAPQSPSRTLDNGLLSSTSARRDLG